jgi:crotonobetaine/carnitine-CoA ligase
MTTLPVDVGIDETIGRWLLAQADRFGDRPALDVVGERRTVAQVTSGSRAVARGLLDLGLQVGDRAALMMANSAANIDTWLGMCTAGLIEVPINTAQRGDLLQYLLTQSGSQAVVVDSTLAERVERIAANVPTLRHVVVHETAEGPRADELDLPAHIARHTLAGIRRDGDVPDPGLRSLDTSTVLYTSGTTGPSKGVVLTHSANLYLARHTAHLMGYTSDDVLYTAFPLFHINAKYTSVMAALEVGARLVMHDRFSASGFWDTCRAEGVTAFNYQGALLLMLFKQPERPDDRDHGVRKAFGAPCPIEIWEPFEERFGVTLTEVYGMTEIAIATENHPSDRRIGSAGKVCAQFEMQIVDGFDRPVPPRTQGEIVVRPKRPGVMIDSYFDMPEATVEAFRNLWFHTGDRGYLDEDGFLWFVDRMKDCIRRRGENISSFEVEKTLIGHPAVSEAAAYAVASELSEDEVMVALVLQPGATLDPIELLDWVQERLAHFAVPRYIRVVDELPKTPSQRIQKFKLRDDGITADTFDRESVGYRVKR